MLADKLNPHRFTAMSGKMAAIVGFIVEEDFTDPAITELVITTDGIVLAQSAGDVGANDIIGYAGDLERNWATLLSVAGLTETEHARCMLAYRDRVKDFRRLADLLDA